MEAPPWTAVDCDRGVTRKNSTNNHWSLFHAMKSLCFPLERMILQHFCALLELWSAFGLEIKDRMHGAGRNVWSGPAPNPTTCNSSWCSPRTAEACSIGELLAKSMTASDTWAAAAGAAYTAGPTVGPRLAGSRWRDGHARRPPVTAAACTGTNGQRTLTATTADDQQPRILSTQITARAACSGGTPRGTTASGSATWCRDAVGWCFTEASSTARAAATATVIPIIVTTEAICTWATAATVHAGNPIDQTNAIATFATDSPASIAWVKVRSQGGEARTPAPSFTSNRPT